MSEIKKDDIIRISNYRKEKTDKLNPQIPENLKKRIKDLVGSNEKLENTFNEKVKEKLANQPLPQTAKYNVKYYYEDDKLKGCINIFKRLPWIKGNVEQIYICPISNVPQNFYFNFHKIHNNEKFYKVTNSYFKFRCKAKTLKINQKNIITCQYNDQVFEFKIGFEQQGTFFVQTKSMYIEEQDYLSKWNNFNSNTNNISDLKQSKVSKELINLGVSALLDYVPYKEFADNLTTLINNLSTNAYEFAYKISKITTTAKYGNLFPKRMRLNYFNEDIIPLLDYDQLMEGVDYNKEELESYVEDTALNMLLYVSVYYDIPLRKYYNKKQKNSPTYKMLDIKFKCSNFEEIKHIEDEKLTFYETEGQVLCYDLNEIYNRFLKNNFVNPHTQVDFSKEYIDKIKKMYKINKPVVLMNHQNDDEEYYDTFDDLADEEDFNNILDKFRKEVENLTVIYTKNLTPEKCEKCEKDIKDVEYATLTDEGKLIKCCSKKCFEN